MSNMFSIEWTGTVNFTKGRKGYKPIAIVDHVTSGKYPGCLQWLKNPKSKVSAHFLVTRTGKILQLVNEEDTAWCNGRVDKPTWKNIVKKMLSYVNPNYYTIGIEHEALDYQPLTEEQYQATLYLHKRLVTKYKIPIDSDHIIGHNRIYSLKPNCPGRNFPWERLFHDLVKR